jgi:hypothetical protein
MGRVERKKITKLGCEKYFCRVTHAPVHEELNYKV